MIIDSSWLTFHDNAYYDIVVVLCSGLGTRTNINTYLPLGLMYCMTVFTIANTLS